MSEVKFSAQHPFLDLFKVFSTSHQRQRPQIIVQAIRSCLSEMKDRAEQRDWKFLYINERLCDCLYYSEQDDERIALRRQFLKQQEHLYGIHARNSLWTLSNVADDALQQWEFDEAEALYGGDVGESRKVGGIWEGEDPVCSLQGLARTYRVKGERMRERFSSRFGESMAQEQYLCLLKKSIEHAQSAEVEARAWFEPDSRRIVNAEAERVLSVTLLRSMNEDATK